METLEASQSYEQPLQLQRPQVEGSLQEMPRIEQLPLGEAEAVDGAFQEIIEGMEVLLLDPEPKEIVSKLSGSGDGGSSTWHM